MAFISAITPHQQNNFWRVFSLKVRVSRVIIESPVQWNLNFLYLLTRICYKIYS